MGNNKVFKVASNELIKHFSHPIYGLGSKINYKGKFKIQKDTYNRIKTILEEIELTECQNEICWFVLHLISSSGLKGFESIDRQEETEKLNEKILLWEYFNEIDSSSPLKDRIDKIVLQSKNGRDFKLSYNSEIISQIRLTILKNLDNDGPLRNYLSQDHYDISQKSPGQKTSLHREYRIIYANDFYRYISARTKSQSSKPQSDWSKSWVIARILFLGGQFYIKKKDGPKYDVFDDLVKMEKANVIRQVGRDLEAYKKPIKNKG